MANSGPSPAPSSRECPRIRVPLSLAPAICSCRAPFGLPAGGLSAKSRGMKNSFPTPHQLAQEVREALGKGPPESAPEHFTRLVHKAVINATGQRTKRIGGSGEPEPTYQSCTLKEPTQPPETCSSAVLRLHPSVSLERVRGRFRPETTPG